MQTALAAITLQPRFFSSLLKNLTKNGSINAEKQFCPNQKETHTHTPANTHI